MADILKITTPLVNKNQIQPNKHPTDPSGSMHLGEISKVIKPLNSSELQGQNNGLINGEEAPSIMMNLLRDPAASVSFLKNIFLLQEIIKLLPVNNNPITQEIQQLFDALLIKPEEMVDEMSRQEQTSTVFKGELFDFLRQLLARHPSNELKYGVAHFLKAVNGMLAKRDILDSVANGLGFLTQELSTSKSLSEQLKTLSAAFRNIDAAEDFSSLKAQTLALLGKVQESILYSPKMEKVVSILIYNLSRFQDNPTFLQEATEYLLLLIDGRQEKSEFMGHLKNFMTQMPANAGREPSKIMNVLAQIIGKQAQAQAASTINTEKVEKIIYSLLSSPCNFTPLLHFVIPVEFMNIKSFAEIWIDQSRNQEDTPENRDPQENIHMLVVFDVQGIGQFEAELFVVKNTLDISLFCPPDYVDAFADMSGRLAKVIGNSKYGTGKVTIQECKAPRSLMDVFKSLPYRRTGVDVRV